LPLAVQHNPQDADGQMGLGGLSPGVVRRLRRWGGGGRGVTASPNRLGVERTVPTGTPAALHANSRRLEEWRGKRI
jgi:hypothetical protein